MLYKMLTVHADSLLSPSLILAIGMNTCHFSAYKTILKKRRQIGNYPSSIKNSFRIEEITIYSKKNRCKHENLDYNVTRYINIEVAHLTVSFLQMNSRLSF